jgi:hypothetical protein
MKYESSLPETSSALPWAGANSMRIIGDKSPAQNAGVSKNLKCKKFT